LASLQAPEKLPRWRGFNLLEKFTLEGDRPYRESDFQIIAEWGFDFVRLPLDYRIWAARGEAALKEIDQAVELGAKYRIHVSLNFHRAPGYCVNPPPEPRDLWSDDAALAECAEHWARFAKRYKGVPNERLSFDLLNEPKDVDGPGYLRVAKALAEAIRKEDPARLIIADGAAWGTKPVPELAALKLAQSTRGYRPMEISHYRAGWIPGSTSWGVPTWPLRQGLPALLYGPWQKALHGPLVLKAPRDGAFAIRVDTVSNQARLVVKADGAVVLDKAFVCGPGEGEWKKAVFKDEYKIWQNHYDRDYAATLPAGTKEVRLEVVDGDWLTWSRLAIGGAELRPSDFDWGRPPGTWTLGASGQPDLSSAPVLFDRARYRREFIAPWKALEAKGVGIHVGEWGAFNRTPHAVALAWMEDLLQEWKEAGWGWALWELRGGFGVLDSGRPDVVYEDFRGHKLDRRMLELLRKY
jgi:hypothetical protein